MSSFNTLGTLPSNKSLQPIAKPLRGLVPSALRAPAAAELKR